MHKQVSAHAIIETDGAAIRVMELSNFLHHFRGVYALCLSQVKAWPSSDAIVSDSASFIAKQIYSRPSHT